MGRIKDWIWRKLYWYDLSYVFRLLNCIIFISKIKVFSILSTKYPLLYYGIITWCLQMYLICGIRSGKIVLWSRILHAIEMWMVYCVCFLLLILFSLSKYACQRHICNNFITLNVLSCQVIKMKTIFLTNIW